MLGTIWRFLKFYLQADTYYKIHSPFVFQFVAEVVEDHRNYYAFTEIEKLRSKLVIDDREIEYEDRGAGSKISKSKSRSIRTITRTSLSKPRQCEQLFKIVKWAAPINILELGTSLGISTAYLASWDKSLPVYTIEAVTPIADVARRIFHMLRLKNVDLRNTTFKASLTDILKEVDTIGIAFIDGHHTKNASLNIYHRLREHVDGRSVLIFDDIYWSSEMQEAWNIIKADDKVTVSIDLFRYGILVFDPSLQRKQHFRVVKSIWKPWQKYI